MQQYKTITVKAVPEHEKEIRDRCTCDKCGEIITSESMYDITDNQIEIFEGSTYPGTDRFGETHTLDICKDCIESFIQYCREGGYNFITTEE